MTWQNLQEKMEASGDVVHMLRNSQIGPYVFPIKAEFSNWRDEQEAWRNTAALLDQSYHMTDLYVDGPDCYRLLSDLCINSFEGFGPGKAKQIVVCNHDGYVIGDSILICTEQDRVSIVGRPPTSNWIQFHAETGNYDVTVRRDERSLQNPVPRETFRFQVQGPHAGKILEEANGGPLPSIGFFNIGQLSIGEHTVHALNHQMSGFPGFEIWGPEAEGESVKSILVEIGSRHGLKLGGARAYSTVAIESGWIPSPTPAVYSSALLEDYRRWLGADSFEANLSLGGSFDSSRIEDYYQTPWDLGYGFMVKFDHEFIGRQALEVMQDRPHRRKVWLYWAREDVLRVMGSMFNKGDRYKYMDMPAAHYATCPLDRILKDGKTIGLSTYPVYTANVRGWISLAMVNEVHVNYGDRVSVLWGEPDGGTGKPVVERHVQTEVSAVMSPRPFEPIRTR